MITSVDDSCFEVNRFVSGKDAAARRFSDAVFDCGNVFFRNASADRLVFEFEAGARFQRFKHDGTIAVLSFTARLTDVFALFLNGFRNGFAICDLRFTDVGFDVEFAKHSVDDNFQVQLAHTRDDGLSGFLIGVSLERRVFFGKFLKRDAHFFLTCFRLRLDSDPDNGFGEGHLFQNNGVVHIAKRIARGTFFQPYDRDDVARIRFFDILTVICVHTQNSSDTFTLALCGVYERHTRPHRAAVQTYERDSSDEGVGHYFEQERAQRFAVAAVS